nr:hypothetical protein [uncultured Draconibacterium sp.]
MKKVLIFILLIASVSIVEGQQWNGSSDVNGDINRNGNVGIGTSNPSQKLDVNGFLNVGGTAYTRMVFAYNNWSGSHGILFNAYPSSPFVNGNLESLGNTKFANDVGNYSGGAGAVMFFGNGGVMDFLISPLSTGKDNDIEWGDPKLRISRNGNIGIGTSAPTQRLEVNGNITARSSDYVQMSVDQTDAGKISVGVTSGTADGFIGVSTNASFNPNLKFLLGGSEKMRITSKGDAVIYGKLEAKEIKVQLQPTADFVFDEDYDLKEISEVELFINKNKHLPDFPSGKEIRENGVNLGQMDAKLLQKIEELTLYMIEQNKRIEKLENENSELMRKVKKLEAAQ